MSLNVFSNVLFTCNLLKLIVQSQPKQRLASNHRLTNRDMVGRGANLGKTVCVCVCLCVWGIDIYVFMCVK